MACGEKKKQGQAQSKFLPSMYFFKLGIKDSTHRFVFGSHSADLPLRISTEDSESKRYFARIIPYLVLSYIKGRILTCNTQLPWQL